MSTHVPPVDDDPYAELKGKAVGVTEPTDMRVVTYYGRDGRVSAQLVHRQHKRRNNGRTRRPTRRASSARRTSRSGARSSPSDSSDDADPADGAGALTEYLASTACWLDAVGLGPWPGWDDLERESNARWSA